MKTISVIVPVYNVEKFVIACLDSICKQKYDGRIECILIDDCGSDNSISIVKKYIEDYKGPIIFKLVHHVKNSGLSAARNTGMEVAAGDYIFFLDSDDEIEEDCLSKMTNKLSEKDYDIVAADFKVISGSVLNESYVILPQNSEFCGKPVIKSYKNLGLPLMATNKLYKRSFLENNHLKFKEGLIHEDFLWSFQTLFTCESLFVLKAKTYVYNKREESITTSKIDYQLDSEHLYKCVSEMREFAMKEDGIANCSTACNYIDSISMWVLQAASCESNEFFLYMFNLLKSTDIYNKVRHMVNSIGPMGIFLKGSVFFLPDFMGRAIAKILVKRMTNLS